MTEQKTNDKQSKRLNVTEATRLGPKKETITAYKTGYCARLRLSITFRFAFFNKD